MAERATQLDRLPSLGAVRRRAPEPGGGPGSSFSGTSSNLKSPGAGVSVHMSFVPGPSHKATNVRNL